MVEDSINPLDLKQLFHLFKKIQMNDELKIGNGYKSNKFGSIKPLKFQ